MVLGISWEWIFPFFGQCWSYYVAEWRSSVMKRYTWFDYRVVSFGLLKRWPFLWTVSTLSVHSTLWTVSSAGFTFFRQCTCLITWIWRTTNCISLIQLHCWSVCILYNLYKSVNMCKSVWDFTLKLGPHFKRLAPHLCFGTSIKFQCCKIWIWILFEIWFEKWNVSQPGLFNFLLYSYQLGSYENEGSKFLCSRGHVRSELAYATLHYVAFTNTTVYETFFTWMLLCTKVA
jgi:hypothetical protein